MKRLLALTLMGVAVWGGATLGLRQASGVVGSAQLAMSDLLFLRAGGPRLGRRHARDDIALVLYDMPTAQKVGFVHKYDRDVQLYRALIEAGAKAVFDTRMVATASAEEFQTIQPMLDQMRAIRDDGSLMRDVWLSAALIEETKSRYDSIIAQNVPNSHPHAVPSLRARLYPLIQFNGAGPNESAPLRIARQVWGLAKPGPAEIGQEMRESGIMSAWHLQAPQLVPKTDIPRRPYRVGQHNFAWHVFPTTTSLVPPVGYWVGYESLISEYPRHSYAEALNHAAPADYRGKIVIVGFEQDVDPSTDTYETPNAIGKATAADVVACAVQTALDGRMMREVPQTASLAAAAAVTILLTVVAGLLRPLAGLLATVGTLIGYFAVATLAYRSGWYVDCAVAPALGLVGGVLGGGYGSWLNLRARQRVVDLFGRYVPRAVVSQLILKPQLEALRLGGVKREVTVLFADVRGFTTFSQDLPPEEVLRQLNAILEIMVESTFEHEGTLDKFIGDAILVLFNAPLDQPDHARRAVRTAQRIQLRLQGHSSGLAVGIGVHRGEAVVGNIGAAQRMEYTAIGSTVNIASRLCGTARAGQIVISRAVAEALGGEFDIQPLPPVQVKGISQPLDVALVSAPPPPQA